jgi:hypothetical protein
MLLGNHPAPGRDRDPPAAPQAERGTGRSHRSTPYALELRSPFLMRDLGGTTPVCHPRAMRMARAMGGRLA